jgi:flagellar motor switch protein FliM
LDHDHALSQEDIDALFKSQAAGSGSTQRPAKAVAYDFRRSDRIPKEQIRALRVVHDTFARSLASSLSAYLRTYVSVNLISVEQLSFREFTTCLPSPTCIAAIRMSPMEGAGVLEISPALAYPMIEVLLGGGKVRPMVVEREMTTIEQQIFDSLLGLILQNLAMSWQSVATVQFAVESHETEPALLQILPPNEAIVVIATEIAIAETSGMMNIGIPSTVVKLLRQKFDLQWTAKRANVPDDGGRRVFSLIADAPVEIEVQLCGSMITFEDLLGLEPGDLLQFEQARAAPATGFANGCGKFRGQIVMSGGKKALSIEEVL